MIITIQMVRASEVSEAREEWREKGREEEEGREDVRQEERTEEGGDEKGQEATRLMSNGVSWVNRKQ